MPRSQRLMLTYVVPMRSATSCCDQSRRLRASLNRQRGIVFGVCIIIPSHHVKNDIDDIENDNISTSLCTCFTDIIKYVGNGGAGGYTPLPGKQGVVSLGLPASS